MVSITSTEPQLSFWQRRFTPTPTKSQLIYDFIAGVLLPLTCFILDPIVFQDTGVLFGREGNDDAFLAAFRIFIYWFSALEILALCYWLRMQSRPTKAESLTAKQLTFFAGFFSAGGVTSALVGLVLLPLSCFGIVFLGIGLLGFSPFLVAWVYWRNAVRANKQHDSRVADGTPARLFAATFLFAIAFPAVIHFSLISLQDHYANYVFYGDQTASLTAYHRLKALRYAGVSLGRFVRAYEKVPDEKKAQINARFFEMTGQGIDERLMRLRD